MSVRKSLVVMGLIAIMFSVQGLSQTSSVLKSGLSTKFEAKLLFYDDTFEPNNNPGQATLVNFGGEYNHQLYWATSYDTDDDSNQPTHAAVSPAADADWYKLEAKAGERLQIEMRILAPKQMDGVMAFYFGTSLIYPINSYGGGMSENIDFTVPPNSDGTYYIQVASYANQQEGRYRLLVYKTLVYEPNTLSLVYPNNSGIWLTAGQTYEIKWNKSGLDNPSINIELYKGGGWYQNIKSNAANTGSYFWQIPAATATGSDYKIKITSASNPSLTDMSDNYFVISSSINNVELNVVSKIKDFSLSQNFPNPFNPETVINYALPQPGSVRLSVFDLLGREVAVLVDERQETGAYRVKFDGANQSAGMYFCRLVSGKFVKTVKMVLKK